MVENLKLINPGPAILISEKSSTFSCIIFFKEDANLTGDCFAFLAKTKAIFVERSKLNSCGGVSTTVPLKLISELISRLLQFAIINFCIFF